jgi:hypothetical protein
VRLFNTKWIVRMSAPSNNSSLETKIAPAALDLAVFGSTTYRVLQLGPCPVLLCTSEPLDSVTRGEKTLLPGKYELTHSMSKNALGQDSYIDSWNRTSVPNIQ